MKKYLKNYVDVSHGIGIPFGGIGTGYSVFGKYGFTRINFDSTPDIESSQNYPKVSSDIWDYERCHEPVAKFAFLINEGDKWYALQKSKLRCFSQAHTADNVSCFAFLPKGLFTYKFKQLALDIQIEAFSPLVPHDLKNSSVPVQIFSITVKNNSNRNRKLQVKLHSFLKTIVKGRNAIISDLNGQIAMYCEDGSADDYGTHTNIVLGKGQAKTIRFYLAWHYPKFKTPSPFATLVYKRFYTREFPDAVSVIKYAAKQADKWSELIDRWHNQFQVPAFLVRLWFSSLSSVITSTMLSDDPIFFEIETPHCYVNTMDVGVYSSWVYLINWPELERMDMDQYLQAILKRGPKSGFVWHSLWNDSANYSEEPTFITRVYRDALWFGDIKWLKKIYPYTMAAANCAYRKGNINSLLFSDEGLQSYDLWMMPGISSYVNSAWIFSLYAIEKMADWLKKPALVGRMRICEMRHKASFNYNKILWNPKCNYWNCFYRTAHSKHGSIADSVFTDQLFGRWVLLLDHGSSDVLPGEKIRIVLNKLYNHNCITTNKFCGWVNGLLPDGQQDDSGLHAKTFWMGPQLNLSSLLGDCGNEKASLDVFQSVEKSLRNNHLAVGEYNRALNNKLQPILCQEEPGKDTPRFPSYPRYKCCWEYLIRILGLKVDSCSLYVRPFKSLDFKVVGLRIGTSTLNVSVKKGWTKVMINNILCKDAKVPRLQSCYDFIFK